MHTLPFVDLLDWILAECESDGSIFGIPRELFFIPRDDAPYTATLFGYHLASPFGPAAGPHTQLTQNILAAWLVGGRFIELKTVQVMDELEIPRPCIDMEDEGYNVEWSQELRLHESAREYAKAWVLVHVLRRLLNHDASSHFGTIFNMSIGYNMEGILQPTMQRFMAQLEDASEEIDSLAEVLRERYPQFADLEIPTRIVSSVTLSTMHGCPPDEIERIARYLIEERGLHTTVKLNPTLLGKKRVLEILHDRLGFHEIVIPDKVFEQDLSHERALELIRSLQASAAKSDRVFGVKLSNTLAMANHRDALPGDEMYMSGRALYPLTTQLFAQLVDELGEDLVVSYSAGADALNVADLAAAGALPITVASDLLKPGGYGRMAQYIEELERAMVARGAGALSAFSSGRAEHVERMAERALGDARYAKPYHAVGLPKVDSPLDPFDCIEAPCVAQCAVCQDVPGYAAWLAAGDNDNALATILHRNPLPGVTGHVCTNLCQTRCTRNAYDQPVAIRRLKRFADEHGTASISAAAPSGYRVAVIGSGPSGLAAGYFLGARGIEVTIFEAKDRPGGMLAIAPPFRLPPDVVQSDISRIKALGVAIECGRRIEETPEALLEQGFDAVFIGCGLTKDAGIEIDGIDARGVYGALEFLDRVALVETSELAEPVVVIGGGNTAMDAARTAQRLTGRATIVLYRRSRAEMTAGDEEIEDLLLEGNALEELVSPVRVLITEGRATGLLCVRNELGEPDADGRRRPVAVEGSEFEVPAKTILLATGQRAATPFLNGSVTVVRDGDLIETVDGTRRTSNECVFAGGDIARGPETIIAACEDGRRAAIAICEQLGVPFEHPPLPVAREVDDTRNLKVERACKSFQRKPEFLEVSRRAGSNLVEGTLSEDDARAEAGRCLQCQEICERCVDVCPNRANVSIRVTPLTVTFGDEQVAIRQPRQIVHVDDLCNECGNCATFCTHQGNPYLEKPRLYLNRADFDAADANAYHIDGGTIERREAGETLRLTVTDTGFLYSAPEGTVELSKGFAVAGPRTPAIPLRPAVEMAVLFDGLRTSAKYLPCFTREAIV